MFDFQCAFTVNNFMISNISDETVSSDITTRLLESSSFTRK